MYESQTLPSSFGLIIFEHGARPPPRTAFTVVREHKHGCTLDDLAWVLVSSAFGNGDVDAFLIHFLFVRETAKVHPVAIV
jgi:hypothetical protein